MKLISFVLGLLLVIFGVLFALYSYYLQPLSTSAKKINFAVNTGDSVKSIAARLEDNGYIKSKYVFIIHSRLLGLAGKLQAGNFRLSSAQSTSDIIRTLSEKGTKDIWIRIPEGSRNEELDLPYNKDEFLIKSKTGKLFPDSYLVPDFYSLDEFLSMVDKNYLEKTKGLNISESDLILASLVEREGQTLDDKKIIAGILKNRLEAGIALQVDASAQYARDSMRPLPRKFWTPPTQKDLKISSPYNTYIKPGLPPSPICNPSLNSLIAVTSPTPSDFLFYIHDPSGEPHYAKTLIEHNQNIAKYLR